MIQKTDIHLHLGVESREQRMSGADGGKVTFSSGNTPQVPVFHITGSKDMIPHLEELGIGKGIILSGGEGGRGSMGVDNREARAAALAAPGVYAWMCNVDPVSPETLESRLAEYKAQGAVGIGEFAINEWIGSPFIEAVFAAAEKVGLPILFHMSPEEGFNYGIADHPGLPLLEEALKRHPDLIIVGHSQPFWHEISGDASEELIARNSWGTGPVTPGGRLSYLLETCPNLYCDLSANSGGNAIMRDESFGLAFLEKFQDRLMFGTDMANGEMVFPLGAWLDQKLAAGQIKESVYRKICVENAQKIFGNW